MAPIRITNTSLRQATFTEKTITFDFRIRKSFPATIAKNGVILVSSHDYEVVFKDPDFGGPAVWSLKMGAIIEDLENGGHRIIKNVILELPEEKNHPNPIPPGIAVRGPDSKIWQWAPLNLTGRDSLVACSDAVNFGPNQNYAIPFTATVTFTNDDLLLDSGLTDYKKFGFAPITSTRAPLSLLSSLKRISISNNLTDFHLVAENGEQHPCSKMLFAAKSKTFEETLLRNSNLVRFEMKYSSEAARFLARFVLTGQYIIPVRRNVCSLKRYAEKIDKETGKPGDLYAVALELLRIGKSLKMDSLTKISESWLAYHMMTNDHLILKTLIIANETDNEMLVNYALEGLKHMRAMGKTLEEIMDGHDVPNEVYEKLLKALLQKTQGDDDRRQKIQVHHTNKGAIYKSKVSFITDVSEIALGKNAMTSSDKFQLKYKDEQGRAEIFWGCLQFKMGNDDNLQINLSNLGDKSITADIDVDVRIVPMDERKRYKATDFTLKRGSNFIFNNVITTSHLKEICKMNKTAGLVVGVTISTKSKKITDHYGCADPHIFGICPLPPMANLEANDDLEQDAPFADFHIVSKDGTRIGTSKMLMAKRSPSFNLLLTSPQISKDELCLEGYDTDTAKALANFIFKGDIGGLMNHEIMINLLVLGHKYEIGQLVNQAQTWLAYNLTKKCALKALIVAYTLDLKKVKNFFLRFFQDYCIGNEINTDVFDKNEIPAQISRQILADLW